MQLYNRLAKAMCVALLTGCVVDNTPSSPDGCTETLKNQTRSTRRLISKPLRLIPDDKTEPVAWRIDSPGLEGDPVARAANALLPRRTEFLLALDFGFQLPDTARIQGITVKMERHRSRLGDVRDDSVQLVVNGRPAGRNGAREQPWSDQPGIVVYGGGRDLWGLELSALDVSQGHFGVALSARMQPFDNRQQAFVSSVDVTVAWCDS